MYIYIVYKKTVIVINSYLVLNDNVNNTEHYISRNYIFLFFAILANNSQNVCYKIHDPTFKKCSGRFKLQKPLPVYVPVTYSNSKCIKY